MTATALRPTEAQFEQAVVELAHTLGWRVAAFRPARRADDRWETPCKYDAKGCPDLTLVRDRVVFAELKSHRGRVGSDQAEWLAVLEGAGGEVYVWRPDDWDLIERVLMSRGRRGG